MYDPAGDNEGYLRRANPEDIPDLARHHREMFEEIREQTGNPVDLSVLAALGNEYIVKLAREIPSGTCIAWVVQRGDRIVSSGAVSIVSYVPVPHDLSSRIAFLHSVYTEKEYRHLHYARKITDEAARYCREQRIRRLYLFASEAGRPVYEEAGFIPVSNTMLLLQ
jgi:GNAT superfamily N-acetyltransferase